MSRKLLNTRSVLQLVTRKESGNQMWESKSNGPLENGGITIKWSCLLMKHRTTIKGRHVEVIVKLIRVVWTRFFNLHNELRFLLRIHRNVWFRGFPFYFQNAMTVSWAQEGVQFVPCQRPVDFSDFFLRNQTRQTEARNFLTENTAWNHFVW